eukprot:scaffold6302_cov61-Cyclotella_meneghiniana.AAC.1
MEKNSTTLQLPNNAASASVQGKAGGPLPSRNHVHVAVHFSLTMCFVLWSRSQQPVDEEHLAVAGKHEGLPVVPSPPNFIAAFCTLPTTSTLVWVVKFAVCGRKAESSAGEFTALSCFMFRVSFESNRMNLPTVSGHGEKD